MPPPSSEAIANAPVELTIDGEPYHLVTMLSDDHMPVKTEDRRGGKAFLRSRSDHPPSRKAEMEHVWVRRCGGGYEAWPLREGVVVHLGSMAYALDAGYCSERCQNGCEFVDVVASVRVNGESRLLKAPREMLLNSQ